MFRNRTNIENEGGTRQITEYIYTNQVHIISILRFNNFDKFSLEHNSLNHA